jgi:Tfp pilus assembly protein PilO
MLQDVPGWAARMLVYVLVGVATLFALPGFAWFGKREIQRWEEKVDELETEIDRMKKERRQEHKEVANKLNRVLQEVES